MAGLRLNLSVSCINELHAGVRQQKHARVMGCHRLGCEGGLVTPEVLVFEQAPHLAFPRTDSLRKSKVITGSWPQNGTKPIFSCKTKRVGLMLASCWYHVFSELASCWYHVFLELASCSLGGPLKKESTFWNPRTPFDLRSNGGDQIPTLRMKCEQHGSLESTRKRHRKRKIWVCLVLRIPFWFRFKGAPEGNQHFFFATVVLHMFAILRLIS